MSKIDDHNRVKYPITWTDFDRTKAIKTRLMAERKVIISNLQKGFMSDSLTRGLEANQVALTKISKEISGMAKHMGAKSMKLKPGIYSFSGKQVEVKDA